MVRKLHAEGFDDAVKLIEENSQNNLIVLFSGSVDAEGKSWCPDCVVAQPVIDSVMSTATDDVTFLHVSVGDRPTWKDANNRFRTDERFRLNCVPTLLKFGQPQRLEEEQCCDTELVKIMLEEL